MAEEIRSQRANYGVAFCFESELGVQAMEQRSGFICGMWHEAPASPHG
ncbi:hypothetical protein [Streptomyces umbrinus]